MLAGLGYAIVMFVATVGGRVWADLRNPGLMVERARAEDAEGVQPWDKALSPLMALSSSVVLYIVAGLDHRFGWSPPFPVWLALLGLVLVLVGYAFSTWAMVENRFFSGLCAFRGIGDTPCVAAVPTGSSGIPAMQATSWPFRALRWP